MGSLSELTNIVSNSGPGRTMIYQLATVTMTALGLVVGLAWSRLYDSSIQYITGRNPSPLAYFVWAVIVSMVFAAVGMLFAYLWVKDTRRNREKIRNAVKRASLARRDASYSSTSDTA